jgi:hypothetical protein
MLPICAPRVSLFFAILTTLDGFPMPLSFVSTSVTEVMPARSASLLFPSTRARRTHTTALCAFDLDVLDARTMVGDHMALTVDNSERSLEHDDDAQSIGDVSHFDHIVSAANGVVNAVGVSR